MNIIYEKKGGKKEKKITFSALAKKVPVHRLQLEFLLMQRDIIYIHG